MTPTIGRSRKTLPEGPIVSYAYTPGTSYRAGGDTYVYDARTVGPRDQGHWRCLIYTYDAAGNRRLVTTPQGTTTFYL